MADIHGEYDRYKAMLEKIQFSDADTLYIIGDVIDRHPCGVDILRDIMSRRNVILLRGNHEQMCLATLGKRNELGAKDLWERNGGEVTFAELMYICGIEERNRILAYLEDTALEANVCVGDRTFHLVHAAPTQRPETCLWTRPWDFDWNELPKDMFCIIGHTPVNYLNGYVEGTPMTMRHTEKYTCIDCGCGNTCEYRRLACLRLDDMAEFYV